MTQHGTTSDDTAAAAAADSRLNKSYAIPELEVFNMLTHPVWVFDIEHKKMHWANKAAIGLWCASSLEELVARDFDTDMSPANRSRMDDQLLQLKAGSKLSESWTMYPNGTKTPTTVNMTGSGIRMQDGRVGVLMEAEISKERYEDSTVRGMEALRQLPVPVFNFDTQGKLIYRNPEAIKVHGLNDEQTDKGGKDADDKQDSEKAPSDMVALFVEQDLGKNILQDVVTEGKDCNIEAELYTNNGASQRWFSVAARRVKNPVAKESKDEHVILLTARDITEILQARKDTATANHKAEFLAVLAHDIRTPIHQIIGYIDLLDSAKEIFPMEQREQVQLLQESAMVLMGITNDLLDYSRIDNSFRDNTQNNNHDRRQPQQPTIDTTTINTTTINTVSFELPLLIDNCVKAVTPEASEKGLILECQYSHPSNSSNGSNQSEISLPLHMLGDPNCLRRVLFNLLGNAIKFTSTGKVSLTISVQSNADSVADSFSNHQHQKNNGDDIVQFEISDTGIGIAPSQQQHIFEKYNRVAHDTRGSSINYGGTGLGLAICRGLVESMGGIIGCSQSALGMGSTFFFRIPLRLPANESGSFSNGDKVTEISREPATHERIREEQSSLHILVVEDNKINQKVVRAMLQRIGHTVTVAENGALAVEALQAESTCFHLVLMDIMMPVMDGMQATKEIRNMGLTKEVLPIVGLTASFQPSERNQYLEIGMTDCLGKPVKLASLKRIINEATGSRGPYQ